MSQGTRGTRWGLLGLCVAFLSAGCGGGAVRQVAVAQPSLRDVPDSVWADLSGKRIFFGHQSIGGNLMEGVADVVRADPRVGVRLAGDESAWTGGQGALAHWKIGRNAEPRVKTDAFAELVDGCLSGKVDVAFHKYCYVDITDTTEVAALFEYYRATMARLRAAHPEVVFVHVTVPLAQVRLSGAKALVRRVLGRTPVRFGSNLARERFNDLMRETYAGKEPVFDLATVESTRPDGTREIARFGGRSVPSLVGAYTDDGAHLNAVGRRRAGEQLLLFLARCCATT